VLHRHVEALLQHRVLCVDVCPRPHVPRSAHATPESAWLESLLTRVEHHRVLEVLVARLVESLRPLLPAPSVLPRARHVELETLPEKGLVVVEARRGGVEADPLSRKRFVVGGSHLLGPLALVQVGDVPSLGLDPGAEVASWSNA